MPKNKRKSVSEPAAEKKKKSGKAGDAKGMRTGVATLTICAAAFGAYYSPHFRTASSDWFERGRALFGQTSATDESLKASASATDKAEEKWAQAPSFRDFLTDEYGEEGARELLGGGETASDVSAVSKTNVGFADYVAAETNASETPESQGVATDFDAAPLPAAPEPGTSFADYVAAETSASETLESQGVATDFDAAPLPAAQEPGTSFADYVAAETSASETPESQGVATDYDAAPLPAAPEPGTSFADYVAAETNASETPESQGVAAGFDAAPLPAAPEPGTSFADYVAAETDASETPESQGVATDFDAASLPAAPEPGTSFADYVAAKSAVESASNALNVNNVKARLAAPASEENETALTTRLQDEMKERGVGNPRIERWGGRFWRASGFATTDEGVATFCEAVDVDPTAAQRAALAKFDAAKF